MAQRLDEQILAETREVKKRQRKRRAGLRQGPGRPDFADLTGSGGRPTTSPLPLITRSASAATLGRSKKGKSLRRGDHSQSTNTLPGSGGGGEEEGNEGNKYQERVSSLQREIRELRSNYNRLRDTHRRLRSEVSSLTHKLTYLKREDDVEQNRRRGMQEIEQQREELDKAKKQLEDTLNYRRTLVYMTNRLKEERLTYDNTLKAYEEALEVRRTESAEVRALAAEVRMAKIQEERELSRLKQLVAKERVHWDNQIEERRREARKREEQKRWAEERKRKEEEEEDGSRSPASSNGEEKKTPSSTKLHVISNKPNLAAIRGRIDELQRAFTEIRLATGLSSVDEMVERFNQHKAHTVEMDSNINEIRTEVERLTERKQELQRKLETIKFSGIGSTDFNHDMIDKLSREGDEARRKLKMIREEHEKVERMNLEIKQSVDAMAQKLLSVRIEEPAQASGAGKKARSSFSEDYGEKESKMDASGGGASAGSTEYTIKQIAFIEDKMTRLLEALDAGGDGGGHRRGQGAPDDSTAEAATTSDGDLSNIMETLLASNKFNVRVRPSTPTSKEHLLLRGAGLTMSNRPQTRPGKDGGDGGGSKSSKDNADTTTRRRRAAEAPAES